MEIEQLPIVKYIYNESGNLGGYPMSDIIQKEIDKQNFLGGSINKSELGISKFNDLIIPAGLLSFSNEYYSKSTEIGGSSNKTQKKTQIKEKINDTIDNELFNKVFDLITKCPGKSRTKKNLEKLVKKQTKKRIIIKQ
jgi:hypothetical protein